MRVVVPEHKVMFIVTASEDEAHFLAAVLNSSVMRLIVAGYTMERQIGTHLTRYVRIPAYDPTKQTHERLVHYSREAHSTNDLGKRQDLEAKIDTCIGDQSIFNLTAEEIEQVRDDLKTLFE